MKRLSYILLLFSFCCTKKTATSVNITDGDYVSDVDSKLYSFAIEYIEKEAFTSIVATQWKQVSGPKATFISCPLCLKTQVTGMTVPGEYGFEFSVTDSIGRIGKDTCTVQVLSPVLPIHFKNIIGQPTRFFNLITCYFDKTEAEVTLTLQSSFDQYAWIDIETKTTHADEIAIKDYSYQNVTYYRFKQTEEDGHISFSQVIQVKNIPELDELIIWSPVYDNFQFTFRSTKMQLAKLLIYNSSGQIIEHIEIRANPGINRFSVPFGRALKGAYVADLQTNSSHILKPFIKN